MDLEKNNCFQCAEGEPAYCEKCFQKLIAENAELQLEIESLLEIIDELKGKSKNVEKHIPRID